MTVLDVSAQTYYDAGDICAKASSGYFEAFKAAMQSFGDTTNMAGSVGDGKKWAESYDQQCKDIYTMSIDMVLALDGYAQVLKQAGYNHALADYDKNSGQPEPAAPNLNPSFTLTPQELASLLVPPSAGGPGRGLVDDGLELAVKVGIPIPDGDTTKLSHSGDVWNSLANNATVTATPGELERAAALFEQVTSPDANFIDEDLRELKTAASDLSGAYGELAQACRDQKKAHDDMRADLEQLVKDLATERATEVVVDLTLSVLASCISFGVGASAVAAKAAVKVAKIIEKFADLIKKAVQAAKIRAAVKIERATAKTKETIQRIKELGTKLVEKFKSRLNPSDTTKPSGKADPNSIPSGRRTQIDPNERDPANIRALTRENESADILSRGGYKVEQNPDVPGTAKNPDYKIEGKIFDNYAPSTSNARNIASTIEEKVSSGQTERVVLNLADSNVDLAVMKAQLKDWPIQGLKEVLVIDKTGSIVPLFP
ncbi:MULTISPECIES: hypothetical protein [unclassified Nocardia]|uniref:CdiA C-terminal domain-containing protein n=1 Tax=unclassified Nocardia TaxID=2637762 RepID=UPI001CE3BF7A|nr:MULTISPECIES: hypothetical protein [unclassified Nocardia]